MRTVYVDGETVDAFFDQSGDSITDIARRESLAVDRRFAQRGAMTPELALRRDSMTSSDEIHVVGFLALRNPPSEGRGEGGTTRADDEVADLVEQVASLIPPGETLHLSTAPATPLLEAIVTRETLDALVWSDLFMVIEPHPGPGHPTNAAWYANSGALSTNLMGWDGTGRKVAVIEGGQPNDYSWLSGIAAIASPSGYSDTHMRRTAGVVRKVFETDSWVGVAGDASIYVANWDQYSGSQPTVEAWAMANGADVANFSWSFSSGANGGLSTTDLYHDWLTLRSPYSMFVSAAGNRGDNPNTALRFVQNRTYNGLVVGATDAAGTAARNDDVMATYSSWRNHTTPNGDRELPEIVAPGSDVSVAGLGPDSGTSYAAPAVSGAVAVITERNSALASYPEAQKAIIMASATATGAAPC